MASKSKKQTKNKPEQVEEALAESQAGGVIDLLDQNRSRLLIGIICGAVAIAAALLFFQLQKQKHLEAGSAFSKAAGSRDIAALDGVLVDFPDSIAAGNALLTKADIQIDRGKAKDAQSTLETFTRDFKSHPRHSQGLFALGSILHIAGDREKAKSYYEQTIAEQPGGELAPLSRIRIGDLALEAGDKDAADQNYQDSFIKYPENPFKNLAEEKIALLTIGNPPVVDRPKPPEPPKKEEKPEKKPKIKITADSDKKASAKPKAGQKKSPKLKKVPAPKKTATKPAVKKSKPVAPKAKTAPAPKAAAKPKPTSPKPAAKPAPGGN